MAGPTRPDAGPDGYARPIAPLLELDSCCCEEGALTVVSPDNPVMVKNASRPGAVAMALVLYLAISIGFFGLKVVGSPARVYVGYDSDPSVMMWFLTWWPHAFTHNLNPFL